jgi:hypothetical protein
MTKSNVETTSDRFLAKIRGLKPSELDPWFRLLEYHEKRMEVRRAIGLRMFTALFGLNLLVLNGVLAHHVKGLFWPIAIFLVSMLLLLFAALGVIEIMNWRDRQTYHPLLGALDIYLVGETNQETIIEPSWKSVLGSWAGTWPGAAALAITIASLSALWNLLKP